MAATSMSTERRPAQRTSTDQRLAQRTPDARLLAVTLRLRLADGGVAEGVGGGGVLKLFKVNNILFVYSPIN
jgi:hypothetical protein